MTPSRGTHGNNGSTCLCLVGQSFFAMVTLKDMDGLYRFATLHYMVNNVLFPTLFLFVMILQFDLHKLGKGSNHQPCSSFRFIKHN